MGAHPAAPSLLLEPVAELSDLAQLIASDPLRHLGADVAAWFSELPFLFKVLSAERPLSLQAHPDSAQARAGFEREERAGIPVDARERIYKDPRHKPELIQALSPFAALSGFRSHEQSLRCLEAFGVAEGDDELRSSVRRFAAGGEDALRTLFEALLSLSPQIVARAIERAVDRGARPHELDPESAAMAPWVSELAELHPSDPGVLAALLLNLVVLQPGEAIFLPAGNLHAYLRGTGLELMASSDNVLRGGLTPKHVDVAELCRVLRFSPYRPEILHGAERAGEPSSRHFEPGVTEFALTLTDVREGSPLALRGPEIWLMLDGSVEVTTESSPNLRRISRGDHVFVSAEEQVVARGEARVARARVPLANPTNRAAQN